MASNNSTHAKRLANPNSPFVTNRKFLSELIKSYESSEPLIQATNTCKVLNHLNFSWTSGLSSWASDLSNSLAQCLLSKNIHGVSVEHYLGYLFPTLLK